MKKNTVLVLLIALVPSLVSAQLKFGVKAGANMTTLSNKSTVVDETSPAFNFRLGGVMRYDFWFLTLQPELMFSAKSVTLNNAYEKMYLKEYAHLTTANPGLNLTRYSLDLPVNLQGNFKLGKTSLYGEFGPFVSLNLGGTFNGSAADYRMYDDDFAFTRLDYGIGAGAGVQLGKYLLSARWDWGLGRIGKEVADPLSLSGGNANVFYHMKSQNLNLSVTYVF